jgi:hypothetical protein
MNIKGLIDYSQPIVAGAMLLGIGIIMSAGVGAYAAYKIKTAQNTIEVTGSAKEAVVADFGRWTINLESRTPVDNQQIGFDRLDRASKSIVAYLEKQGFKDIETPSPSVRQNYTYPERSEPILTGYTVSRQVIVRSADIDAIAKLAENISPLTGASYEVTTGGLELTYQKLPDMRVKLLSEAIKDAKARAEAIAKETGRKVGTIKSATGGVVQVLPQGGVDISDYGSYDTQSKNKDVMVTVRASFTIE